MNSPLLSLAVRCVRGWTRLYTWRMPAASRETRRAEIESDLWEFQCDEARDHALVSASHILLRLVIGIPDDLGWRVEQAAVAGTLAQRSIALSARVAGAAVFICALWVMDADASRRRPTIAVAGPVAVFDKEIEGIMKMRAGNVPHSAGRRLPLLTAGVVATVGMSMLQQLAAQSPPNIATGPEFVLTSIKPNPTDSAGPTKSQIQPGGRFVATNGPLRLAIGQAYQVSRLRLVGGLRWIGSPHLDLTASRVLVAQNAAERADITVDAAARAEVIDGALKALNEAYVFPEVAKQMEEAIRGRQRRNEYDVISSGRQFAQILTEHLRAVSHDLHLSVNFIQQGPPPPPPPSSSAQTLEERQRVVAGRQNFGFVRVERLAGNIGYLDLRGFMPPGVAGETATAAMTFLASSDAVIFDLRQNGGGDPTMVAFITSYLFGLQPVHLNDFYSRLTNETRQSWTLAYVPGRRLTNKDVYILTSSRTFSGAEEFTYNLKYLKRATVVGETTGGGAHTVAGRRINNQFAINIPSGRPINAVTKTNWEGVGVEPDVKVAAENALKAAHLIALEKQQQALPGDAPALRNEVTTTIQSLRKELGAVAASIATPESVKPVAASKASEDFESGTLANWRVDKRGSGGWFSYANGKTPPDRSQSDPNFPFEVPDPPQGKFAAVTDTNGPGRHLLYRDITLDGRYLLHLTIFYVNSGSFSAANTSNRDTITDEQQYRIDLVSASAPVDSMAKEHVLANIFQGQPNDPSRRQPTEVMFDLSPWAGQTIRLRFAAADNQGPLRAGVDNIKFERLGQ